MRKVEPLPTSGTLRMRPRARLISLIGDELISDESVAVVELVKNAYDADATHVTVKFAGNDPTDPDTLMVADNGYGMTLDEVMTGWFEPGTVLKKHRQRSPAGRLYLGAMGIGRFAAARLAPSLYMETRRKNEQEGVTVLLDWGAFGDESYLDEITLEYHVTRLPNLDHGTVLELPNLHVRKHWTEDDFRSLHTRLSRLVSPFTIAGDLEVSDFRIDLTVPGYPELTGTVRPPPLIGRPRYRLTGKLETDGNFSGVIEIEGLPPKPIDAKSLAETKGEPVLCGAFEVEIRAWDRDRPGLLPHMHESGKSLSDVRKILDDYAGVSMYRDGFRVHPYGEKGIDWLSLDTRSRQNPTFRLANNQIVAAIRVSRDQNSNLVDRTTREGLVHNVGYLPLTQWFTRILAVLEEERYFFRPREESKHEEASPLFEPFDMSDVVAIVDKQLGKTHPVSRLVKQKEVYIREGVRRLQEHNSRVLLAAGLGQLVDIVVHEIGAPLGRLSREVDHLERQVLNAVGHRTLDKLLGEGSHERLNESFGKLKGWMEQIASLRARLVPKAAGKRGSPSTFAVVEEIEDNLGLFAALISKQNIKCAVHGPRTPIAVHMSRSNLGQIIANLLDNSIYWLTRHHGDGNGGQLDIRVTRLKHGFKMCISDDGPGIAVEDEERVFDAEFSRRPNGMGLGLFIARQVIENYGKLILREDRRLPGACFQAVFEQNVGL